MADQIRVQPAVVDLLMYAGDGLSFRIYVKDPAGAPIDITGTVKAQIRLERLAADPPVLDFAVNLVDAYQGIARLSLTGVQTQSLTQHPSSKGGHFVGVWDVQWTPVNSEPFTLCQGKAECGPDVTR